MTRAHHRRLGSWITVWAVAAVVVAASAATVVVLRNARSPLASDAPAQAVVVEVTHETRSESAVVGLAARRSEGAQATFAASGTLTSLTTTPGMTVEQGVVLATVDDLPVVAMSGSAPLYRTLSASAQGEDVSRLQQFLYQTGYLSTAPDGTFGATTVHAVRAWNLDHGRRADAFDPATIVWIGEGQFEVADVPVKVGDQIGPGQPLAIGPAQLEGVNVDEPSGGIADGAYQVQVADVSVSYVPGTNFISDPADAVALITALGGDEGAGQLAESEPTEVAVVPASAVVTDHDGRTCVYPDATTAPVLIDPVGSAAGTIHLDPGTPLTEVLANPAQVRDILSCSS